MSGTNMTWTNWHDRSMQRTRSCPGVPLARRCRMKTMSDERTRELAGYAGAALFGVACAIELVRVVILRETWTGISTTADRVLTLLSVALWAVSAVLLVRRSERRVLPIFGAFVLFAHGILGTVMRSAVGPVFVALAVLMPIVERLAFGGRLTVGTPTTVPPRPSVGREVL